MLVTLLSCSWLKVIPSILFFPLRTLCGIWNTDREPSLSLSRERVGVFSDIFVKVYSSGLLLDKKPQKSVKGGAKHSCLIV